MRQKFVLLLAALVAAAGSFSVAAAQTTESPKPGEHRASLSETDTPAGSAAAVWREAYRLRNIAMLHERVHVVETGEMLADIAKQYGVVDANGDGDYLRLFYANPQIKDPSIIEPGWEIRIPLPHEKLDVREVPRPIVPRGPPASNAYSSGSSAPAPPQYQGYELLYRIRGCESYGDPNAPGNYTADNPSPRSTASGAYQWLDSTWAGRYGVPRALMATPEQQEAVAREMFGDPNNPNTRPWLASKSCWG